MGPLGRRFSGIVLGAIVLPLAVETSGLAAESTEAEALIREGLTLRREGHDERALPLFEKAYAVARNPRTAGQLGLSEMSVGYFVEAERHLAEALSFAEHPWIAKNAEALRSTLDKARENIGELTVTGRPSGAEIWVNGRQVGRLPQAVPLRLNKGVFDVELRAPGHIKASKDLRVRGGDKQSVTLTLEKEPSAAPSPRPAPIAPVRQRPVIEAKVEAQVEAKVAPPPPPAPVPVAPAVTRMESAEPPREPSNTNTRPILAWTTAAIAGVALVLGVVETATWANKQKQFDDHTSSNPLAMGHDCGSDEVNYGGDDCKALHDDLSRARTRAFVGYGVAAGFTVVSAILFATSRSDHPTTDHALSCAPELLFSTGLACRLAF